MWGPKRQCQSMFKADRIAATLVYLVTLVATFVVAVFVPSFKGQAFVVLALLCVQFLALIWYCASYIPGGRMMLKSLVCGMCNRASG